MTIEDELLVLHAVDIKSIPAPSAQPTDEAKQMLDPTLNLG